MADTARLVWLNVRHQNRMFWRSPVSAFFTLVFPLMFLVLFNLLFGGDIDGTDLTVAQFFAPTLAAFAAASATYSNIGIATAIDRDDGVLMRVVGTPLPRWIHLAGRLGSGVWIAALATSLMLAVGVAAYDVEVRVATLPAAMVTFALGASCFAALGLALAALTPSGDATPAVANATLLPVAFISDVFIPVEDGPAWLVRLGEVFPLRPLVVPRFPNLPGDSENAAECERHGDREPPYGVAIVGEHTRRLRRARRCACATTSLSLT